MGENNKRLLLVKHFTGRMLIDTSKPDRGFALEEAPGGWKMAISEVTPAEASAAEELRLEINMFYTETDEDGTIRKWWLYGKQDPILTYDQEKRLFTIFVDSRIAYTNQSVR